jgi:hypothetical protein
MDDRSLQAYLQHNSAWNLEENGHMDHFNVSSNGNGGKLLNSSVHFPSEMRYKIFLKISMNTEKIC